MQSVQKFVVLAIGITGGTLVQAAPVIYGQVHVSVDRLDNGTDGALNVSSNATRFGIKGDIQVGGDLAGIYQIESEVNADTAAASSNNTVLASRDTFVGLQGKGGTARVGRFDTPVKLIGRQIDLFKDQVGDLRNLTRGANGSGTTNTLARFDERPNNSLGYTSPEYFGFKGALQYSSNVDSSATANNDNDLVSGSISYAQGPAYVGLGYETVGYVSSATPPVAGSDPSAIRIGGYYDIADFRLIALWQTVSGTDAANDEDVYGLGARYVVGAWSLKTQGLQLKSDGVDKDATLVALGADYALQKGVTLYLAYATVSNDGQQRLTPYKEGRSDNLAITTPGNDADAISLGTIIKF